MKGTDSAEVGPWEQERADGREVRRRRETIGGRFPFGSTRDASCAGLAGSRASRAVGQELVIRLVCLRGEGPGAAWARNGAAWVDAPLSARRRQPSHSLSLLSARALAAREDHAPRPS